MVCSLLILHKYFMCQTVVNLSSFLLSSTSSYLYQRHDHHHHTIITIITLLSASHHYHHTIITIITLFLPLNFAQHSQSNKFPAILLLYTRGSFVAMEKRANSRWRTRNIHQIYFILIPYFTTFFHQTLQFY